MADSDAVQSGKRNLIPVCAFISYRLTLEEAMIFALAIAMMLTMLIATLFALMDESHKRRTVRVRRKF